MPQGKEDKIKRLGDILIEKGLINAAQLNIALSKQQITKKFLGAILVNEGMIKDKDLLLALSAQFGIPMDSLKNKKIDWDFVRQFSSSLIQDYKCLPIYKDEWAITFAIVNPLDAWAFKKAEEEAKGLKVKFVLVCQEEMQEAINKYKQNMQDDISKLFG